MKVPASDEYYAMVDSGTNVTIVPLHPDMCGEKAERKVPSATVEGLIAQVLKFGQERRLVVAMPQSAILISQEWHITDRFTVAGWTFIAQPKDGKSEILLYTSTRGDTKTLAMKNGLPYLSKELLWRAMEKHITARTTSVSGHPWPELKR